MEVGSLVLPLPLRGSLVAMLLEVNWLTAILSSDERLIFVLKGLCWDI